MHFVFGIYFISKLTRGSVPIFLSISASPCVDLEINQVNWENTLSSGGRERERGFIIYRKERANQFKRKNLGGICVSWTKKSPKTIQV